MELKKVVYNRNEEYFEGELWRRKKFNNFKTGDFWLCKRNAFERITYIDIWA